MCNPTSADLIYQIVQQRVQGDEMFTAFEISLAVQESAREQHQPVERHREMRGTIHQTLQTFVDSGVYQKELRDVGARDRAYVYFPTGSDVSNYMPLTRHDKKGVDPNDQPVTSTLPAGVKPVPQPVPAQSGGPYNAAQQGTGSPPKPHQSNAGAHGQPTTGTLKPNPANSKVDRHGDARNTLTVPSETLRNVGFTPHEIAYVYTKQDAQGRNLAVLTKHVPAGNSVLTKYTVDYGNNVRITFATLSAAGVATGPDDTYDFEEGDGEVLVSAHD
jgi:hypothetical protein